LGAYAILNRSIQTSADDALTIQAVQDSDEKRRIAQTLHTMEQQRTTWETGQLTNLEKRLWPSGSVNDNSVKQERIDVLSNASEFVTRQRRMREALLNTDGGAGADTVATLATVKRNLLPDEALVLVIGVLGDVVKVCVRADRTWSFVEHVDEAALVKDIRVVRIALTSTEPASIEADSQFPAAEAVRLYTVLFGGLEDCLRASPRIYLITPDGALATVPPAVLLTEPPKVLGAGLDLQSAHWMIRDHSFVRTSSISEFVATKSLSKSVRATLDYLGVGDPVLLHRNAVGVSGGEFAARGSLHARGGPLSSLEELPETSEELQQVAALHDRSKARVLVREAASEEAFRLQPLSEFDVIHFATHGLMKEELSGLSEPSLVLTPNPDGDTLNNGLLTTSEIASLPLRARVVILSACNSAQYEMQTIVSGIQGLANSFAIAGVPSMVASLWPIESAVTRDLITSLFQVARGSENVAIADALAIAMRRHLDGRTPRPLLHPRFWASLVVIGDGAVKLNASNERVSRDLGPFSEVNVTDGGEILAGATLGADYVMSAFGDWDGARFP
jgi:CHAT domain-containing protein